MYGFTSHFLRTATGIRSGADTFDKSRLVKTFLTNLVVTGTLSIFRLVQERKAGEEKFESSRLEFLEFFLLDAEGIT